jgi:hypothetical protein
MNSTDDRSDAELVREACHHRDLSAHPDKILTEYREAFDRIAARLAESRAEVERLTISTARACCSRRATSPRYLAALTPKEA